jgi:hypothetical protein
MAALILAGGAIQGDEKPARSIICKRSMISSAIE